MKKYIDAEKLREDIDNWNEAMADAVGEYSDGVRFALAHFTFVIDSLQQEQTEVDLEKEIKNERSILLDLFGPMNGEQSLAISNLARHFYELGLNARKEQ